ncbi:type II secretion system protein [Agrococcus sp. SL85]|uniref:PulJ/GspJ family protein n=1 Tax=Agrococcus sp. SL85 TaxID=2995141 RepID=UPI00226C961B|nr:type II secretion system protein [Agrococcus sp. SL85]WAC66370.1 type II secretion system protein [Agrococcus sp. SL85]
MSRLAPADRERGLTLVELLVAISLLAIAMTLVTALVVSVSRTFTREEAQHESSTAAALGMQQLSRVVRAAAELDTATGERAPAFAAASPTALSISAYLDVQRVEDGPVRVDLTLDPTAGTITEQRFASYRASGLWQFRTTPFRTRVVLRDVIDAAVFTYRRANGTSLPARALTAAERREIAAVRVSYAVQADDTGRVAPSRLEATVSLPNIELTRTAP